MRIQLVLAEDGSTVIVRADRCSPTMPPARVAAALATAVESALQTHRQTPFELEPAPVEPALDEPAPVKPLRVKLAPVEPVPAAEAALRRRALELLDAGRSDTQVCAQLGISQGRLLRWDDDLAHDMHVEQLAAAGGAR